MNLYRAAKGVSDAMPETSEAAAIQTTILLMYEQVETHPASDTPARQTFSDTTRIAWDRNDPFEKTYRIPVLIKPMPHWKRFVRRALLRFGGRHVNRRI